MSSESAAPSSPSSTFTSNNGDNGEPLGEVDPLPSGALVAVGNGLRQDRGPQFFVAETKLCFQATLQVLASTGPDRLEPHAEWFASEFLVEVLPELLSRLLKEPHPRRWPSFFQDVLSWSTCLVKIGCILLNHLRDCPAPDEKAIQTVRCMLVVFDPRSEFSKAYRTASRGRPGEPVEESVEEQDGEGVAWRLVLAESFQEGGGIESICKILAMMMSFPEFDFIESLIILSCRVAYAGLKVLDLSNLGSVVIQVLEELKDGPPSSWHCTLIQMSNIVPSLLSIISLSDSHAVAEDVVGRYQQHVVAEHLKKGTFNTRLAAVNWLDSIIYRAFRTENESGMQRIRTWLEEECIVELMLSEHLEKAHYAEQALGALRMMAQAGLLKDNHVKSLYRVIEPEGTFEGLKENVHSIMLHLLDFLKPEHIKSALEIAGSVVGDVISATRMSNLVSRVVSMDREAEHYEQTMEILWSMMVRYSHVRVESDPLWRSFTRCIQFYNDCDCVELREKYLRLAVKELREGKVTVMMLQVLMYLYEHDKDAEIGVLEVLVLALQRYHDETPKDISRYADGGCNFITTEAPAVLYDVKVIAECLKDIKTVAIRGKVGPSGVGLSLEVAEQIWDLLVLDPVCLSERIHSLNWFKDLASCNPEEPFAIMTDWDAKALLHRCICGLDPYKLDFTGFTCFRTFFAKVSPVQGTASPEVNYLWKVLLNSLNADVAAGAQEMVGSYYAQTTESQHEFIRHTMTHLKEGICELAGGDSNEMSCSEAIDVLTASQHCEEMERECTTRIMRGLQALDFMMKQSHSLSLKGELSQSEDIVRVLLYLADCRHAVHDVACSLLDNLPLRSGVLSAIQGALVSRDVSLLTAVINTAFHNGVAFENLLPEKARYVILALTDVLYSNSEVEKDVGDLKQLCLSFLLDMLENVHMKQSNQADQIAKCGRRLHREGICLVSRLSCSLVADIICPRSPCEDAQPLEIDTDPNESKNCEIQPNSPSACGPEPRCRPGSPIVTQGCRSSQANPDESSQMPISNCEIHGPEDKQNQASVDVPGTQMEDVQEEPSRQRSSLMDISTDQATGRSSSMDVGISCQQVGNAGGDPPDVGREESGNNLPLPGIAEDSPGGVCGDDAIAELDKSSENEMHKHQEAALNLRLQNCSSAEDPVSACSSSEVGPSASHANSDRLEAVEAEASALELHADNKQESSTLLSLDSQKGLQLDIEQNPSDGQGTIVNLLKRVVEYYVGVIGKAGQGWGCTRAGHRIDIELVKEATEQLCCLAGQYDSIVDMMMSSKGVVDVLVDSLLNPVECIRKQMVILIRRINRGGSKFGQWLFHLLKHHRKVADEYPEHCQEFYGLLQEFCKGFEKCTRLSEVEDAGALLQEVLQNIRCQPYEETPRGTRLGCQLRLLAALVKVLEPDCIGKMSIKGGSPAEEGDFVQFLIKDILFPETYLLRSVGPDCPSVAELMAVLKTKSTQLLTREAAFDLLLMLMKISSVSHKMVMDIMWDLHFHPAQSANVENHWTPAKKMDGYVGLQNAGATCYMNAVLQQLFMHPAIRQGVLLARVSSQDQDRGVFYPFQRLFGHLQCSDRSSFFPGDFIEKYTHSNGQVVDIRQHHDALEFFQRTQELVDDCMSRQGLKCVIKNEIGGLFSQQIICRDQRKVYFSETQQPYTEVTLEMFGKTNLQESLEAYVSGERLEGDNAYFCHEWGKKVPALKRNCIKTLPHTLVIHLKRFELDYETMETFKIQERFEFPLTLDMFPYTSSFLLQKEGLSNEEGVDCDSTDTVHPSQCEYQLMGVVVHKGEIDGGHYYSFIKERSCEGKDDQDCKWWRFDDSSVDEWDVSRLDEDCFGGPKIDDDPTDRPRDLNEETVKSRANNAYLLIYEQISKDGKNQKDDRQLSSDSSHQQLPLSIFKEVLIENVRLLSTTRVTDQSFMHFMQKLLQTMPSTPSHRKMRRLTPPGSKSGSESSSGSENGGGQNCEGPMDRDTSQEQPQESEECSRRQEDAEVLGHDIASLVFEYMLRIMFTPFVFSEADYASWEHILKVTQDSQIALQVALQKLALYSDRVARCLMPHACEASSDFAFHFVMAVIKEARRIKHEPVDVKCSPIYQLGMGIIDACDSRTIVPLDLLRVFEVVRFCALMTLKWGHHTLVLRQLSVMQRTSAKLSALMWAGRNSCLPKKLESLNLLLIRIMQGVAHELGEESGNIPNIVKDCFHDDLDPDFVKGFVHPLLLVQPEFVEFLQKYTWDNDNLSMWVLDGLLDLLTEDNDRSGWLDQFDKIAAGILKLVGSEDCFHAQSQRAQYLIQPKRDRDREGLYHTIFSITSCSFRWKLVYLVMKISKQEASEDFNRLFRNANNERLLSWVAKDGALSQLDSFVNRKEVYEWTRQIIGAS